MAKEFEFVVCDTETDDEGKLWDVVGFDGMTKVTLHAKSEWHARNIANALNNGAQAFVSETFETQ